MARRGGEVGVGVLERVGARRAEDRAAAADDPVGLGDVERAAHALDQPAPAFEDADAGAPLVDDPLDDGADHRVQAGAIAAAGQQADFHGRFLFSDRSRRAEPLDVPGAGRPSTHRRDDQRPDDHRQAVQRRCQGRSRGEAGRARSAVRAAAAGLGGHQDALDPGGVDPAVDEVAVAEDPPVEGDGGLDPLDRPARRGPGASRAMASARVGAWTISLPTSES